ncbi:MAG TPA: hypothetical protein VJ644_01375 [Jiangellaceae bacterium]|nr:hypothetical protein [Jiangellaceae bacterium]
MSTGNGHNNGRWDDMPENMLRLPGPDAVLPDRMLAGILYGRPVRVGAPPEALVLSDLVTALRRPALPDELHGEGAALAAYRQAMSTDDVDEVDEPVSRPSRPAVGPKIAAVALAASLGMGGVAAAAVGGSLPDPLQDIAHVLFGAPPAQPDSNDGSDPGGIAPIPMPTDASTRSPGPEEPSATSPTPLPTDSPTLEACTPEMALTEPCGLVAESGPEATDLIGPDPTATPSGSELDATGTDGSGTTPIPTPAPDESPESPGRSSLEHPTGVPSWLPSGPPGAPFTLPGLGRPTAD